MKETAIVQCGLVIKVAPLVGAWIERDCDCPVRTGHKVAPLVGAWIESEKCQHKAVLEWVAPLVGAWIERERADFINKCIKSLLL